jgi:hypothetical protein
MLRPPLTALHRHLRTALLAGAVAVLLTGTLNLPTVAIRAVTASDEGAAADPPAGIIIPSTDGLESVFVVCGEVLDVGREMVPAVQWEVGVVVVRADTTVFGPATHGPMYRVGLGNLLWRIAPGTPISVRRGPRNYWFRVGDKVFLALYERRPESAYAGYCEIADAWWVDDQGELMIQESVEFKRFWKQVEEDQPVREADLYDLIDPVFRSTGVTVVEALQVAAKTLEPKRDER